MNRFLTLFVVPIFFLVGCATYYTYGGRNYNTQDEVIALMQIDFGKRVDAIIPLPMTLSNKKLIFMMPCYKALMHAQTGIDAAMAITRNNAQRSSVEITAKEIILRYKLSADLIRKRNIYREVEFLTTPTYSISPSVGDNEDILYVTCNLSSDGKFACGSFSLNKKYGKQVVAYDMSSTDVAENDKALLQAIESLAMRE